MNRGRVRLHPRRPVRHRRIHPPRRLPLQARRPPRPPALVRAPSHPPPRPHPPSLAPPRNLRPRARCHTILIGSDPINRTCPHEVPGSSVQGMAVVVGTLPRWTIPSWPESPDKRVLMRSSTSTLVVITERRSSPTRGLEGHSFYPCTR